MDIDGICHSAFCGRLEARFPGWAILYTTCPGLGLAEPDKSRLFSLLTVHSRPPFPFTFCFLPPVNSGGTAGAVFCPVGFGDEYAAADRERSRLRAGAGVPIVKDNAVAVLTATALPADQGFCLFALLPMPGYSFSDGHSIFKVLFTDELSQVYTFLIACAICP